jgi:multisubunit Na+/H+ antiporter MnhG subunit
LYTRAHAAALILGLPAGVLLIGLAAASGDLRCAAALVVLGGLMASLGPVVSFACASAAHADGLAPVIGRIARSGQQR